MRLTTTLRLSAGAVILTALVALLQAVPAGASRFPASAPLVGHSRAVTLAGHAAAGASVTMYPDVPPKHTRAVLHPAWMTTTGARGRFTLRAAFRGNVERAANQNGGWVNFMVIIVGKHRFAVWEFPAHWSSGSWHLDPGSLPRSITLAYPLTAGGHGHR
jgi:hypothetical protein